MKSKLSIPTLLVLFITATVIAQDRTIVNATNSEISDNLDLRAIASIFGDAKNLEDFERQLNDPTIQISNLDLNNDNQVDYLRVVESVEGYAHLIVIQSVLGRDTYQDVATIEVERDKNNHVQVQVVGDVYMYGENYIYEPVYVYAPVIYTSFWQNNYRPYCSTWYWNYYPSYYFAWNPCPIFRYRNNVSIHINFSHEYNYVNIRRCHRAEALYSNRRSNYCEREYPNRAFSYRNSEVRNRYELDQNRGFKNSSSRNEVAYYTPRNGNSNPTRNYDAVATRNNTNPRTNATSVRDNNGTRKEENTRSRNYDSQNEAPRNNTTIRNNPNAIKQPNAIRNDQSVRSNPNPVRGNSGFANPRMESNTRNETPRSSNTRNESPRENSSTRMESPRNYNNNRNDSSREISNSRNNSPRANDNNTNMSSRTNNSNENSNSRANRR